jgi:eukaryotic-like serine/threonine-protein kinase
LIPQGECPERPGCHRCMGGASAGIIPLGASLSPSHHLAIVALKIHRTDRPTGRFSKPMNEKILLNNRYQLEERLGSGGMAMVYRAQDLMLERTVAIKLLRADFSKDPDFRERFRQEAKAAANLSHPNIVTVHDFGLDSGRLFIVMEFVPGTDLKTIIQRRGSFPMEEAIALMVQACAGLGYAHRAGLVHCDVKPQNMLVTPDKRLKVVDFGIARALATIAPEEQSDIVWGSPQYFSPEQAAGNAPSPASDVYSLGVILYEMLTGQLPFSAPGAEELARMHRDVPPPSVRKIKPDIPVKLEQIILKVLSKEPSARYRTADQLGRVLVTFTQQSPTVATIPNPGFPPPDPMPPDPVGNGVRQPMPAALPMARPAARPASKSQPLPQPAHTAPRPVAQRPPDSVNPGENPLDIDWITWLLGLMALIAVGGLIPFCIWVYYVVYPPF